MKTILLLGAFFILLAVAACQSPHNARDGMAPMVGATTGLASESTHEGNSDGSRTDLR